MIDFPAYLVNTPCVVVGTDLPAGVYDAEGNCVIKIPLELTRPEGTFPYLKEQPLDPHR